MDSLDGLPAGRSPLLVFADTMDRRREFVCSDILLDDGPTSVLVFDYHGRSRDLIGRLQGHGGTDRTAPGNREHDLEEVTIIALGGADERESGPAVCPRVTVEQCKPVNLTSVGIAVTGALERHDGEGLRVCLGSVTTLLQYVGVGTGFKFLHVTLDRLSEAGGVVHAHLDPDAVDEETVWKIRPLFESVLERTGEGWTVSSA